VIVLLDRKALNRPCQSKAIASNAPGRDLNTATEPRGNDLALRNTQEPASESGHKISQSVLRVLGNGATMKYLALRVAAIDGVIADAAYRGAGGT
jgi:hypothetical protein